MVEENVAKTAETVTPVTETTPQQQTTPQPTHVESVAKESPKEVETDRLDKHPRFKEVIGQKNEALRRAQEAEARIAQYEQRANPEPDPFADLAPEEREQTEKFINKYVAPRVKSDLMKEIAPFMQEVQNEKLNKQVSEAKTLASKVGIDFDERLPEIVDYLSRPENKGRLTAKEALISLYADEFLDTAKVRGRDEVSRETKELMEKKKLANMQVLPINPNVAIQSDEAALRNMSHNERMTHGIRKAMELAKQGVKNPKVKYD